MIIEHPYDPAWTPVTPPTPYDYSGDYPVLDGNGAAIIAGPFDGWLGPELVTNGGFDTDTAGPVIPSWGNLSGVTSSVVNGEANTSPGTGGRGLQQVIPFVAGRSYKVKGDIRVISGAGTVRVQAVNSSYVVRGQSVAVSGTTQQAVEFIVTAAASTDRLLLSVSTSGNVGGFDNISVREIRRP